MVLDDGKNKIYALSNAAKEWAQNSIKAKSISPRIRSFDNQYAGCIDQSLMAKAEQMSVDELPNSDEDEIMAIKTRVQEKIANDKLKNIESSSIDKNETNTSQIREDDKIDYQESISNIENEMRDQSSEQKEDQIDNNVNRLFDPTLTDSLIRLSEKGLDSSELLSPPDVIKEEIDIVTLPNRDVDDNLNQPECKTEWLSEKKENKETVKKETKYLAQYPLQLSFESDLSSMSDSNQLGNMKSDEDCEVFEPNEEMSNTSNESRNIDIISSSSSNSDHLLLRSCHNFIREHKGANDLKDIEREETEELVSDFDETTSNSITYSDENEQSSSKVGGPSSIESRYSNDSDINEILNYVERPVPKVNLTSDTQANGSIHTDTNQSNKSVRPFGCNWLQNTHRNLSTNREWMNYSDEVFSISTEESNSSNQISETSTESNASSNIIMQNDTLSINSNNSSETNNRIAEMIKNELNLSKSSPSTDVSGLTSESSSFMPTSFEYTSRKILRPRINNFIIDDNTCSDESREIAIESTSSASSIQKNNPRKTSLPIDLEKNLESRKTAKFIKRDLTTLTGLEEKLQNAPNPKTSLFSVRSSSSQSKDNSSKEIIIRKFDKDLTNSIFNY